MPSLRAFSRTAKRSAASLYAQMWHQRLRPPNSECPAKASGDSLTRSAIDNARDAARLQGVEANLVETAKLARFELRRKRRRQKNFALLLDDEFTGVGRPALQLLRLGADAGALLEILVRPDMDDPVQRADLGVPEGGEWRQLGAHRQCRAEPLLELGNRPGLQGIGAHFDNHEFLRCSVRR